MAKKELTGYIYQIKNKVNGKLYIGRTNNYQRRYNEHFGKNESCTILKKAMNKYGKENFEMKPLISFTASNSQILDSTLNLLEKYYIERYDTYESGYNATLGGEGNCGWIPSKETLLKRSLSLKGRKISEKERERLRNCAKNRVWTLEQREKQRQNMLNRDPEIQKKIADKLRGRKRNVTWTVRARKQILQYSLDGIFIKEYDGISKIPNCDTANIVACCKNKINSAYGFIWKYKQGAEIPLKIVVPTKYHISNRAVVQYDKNGNFINEFESATKAAKITSIGRKAICNCITRRSKSAGGYIWKYKEERRKIS